MIEFHRAALLINNAVDVTGLYPAVWIGDDVCASLGTGRCWHYDGNGPYRNEVFTGKDLLHE